MTPSDTACTCGFTWNGKRYTAQTGDTLALALWRNGIMALAATRKRHLPLGLSGSHVAGILVRVDGRPNVRADRVLIHSGLVAEAQNTWPSPRFDVLRLARAIPAATVYGGFEHSRLVKSGSPLFQPWERTLAFLAGVAEAPDAPPARPDLPAETLEADVLVVGGGPAGVQAALDAAREGQSVVLITRGTDLAPGQFAGQFEGLAAPVTIRSGHEVFGFYRNGTLALAAPDDPRSPAILTRQNRVVLATGSSSVPPLVPGNHLPGVIDARTALHLAQAGAIDDVAVVVGTGLEDKLARMLDSFGIRVAAVRPVSSLTRIEGQDRVGAALFGRDRISCGLVIHAGPWIADDTLWYQLVADGDFQLRSDGDNAASVERVGSAALPAEPVHVPPGRIDGAHVCPCMDVTVGEIRHALGEGHSDPEVVKRLTSCGMGPCQGFPCWHQMAAVIAHDTGTVVATRPSRRAPGRRITVAQAAGLLGLVKPL